ncbi:hypothetical protein A8L34_00625 [Bacillus sp. FJAT-27264]|uniref:DUF4179 domain-containing protein n=1 Tax=Paenibacillus sp. (strain DSM 101736 / FJAT-27264) TaxID=1850362 RepID=UPI000807CFBE|nr:DUF4179 domain-containing protein [Bacillus sp. FJAT-27264]OBZ18126.1 hypothetical protein A8L34_00625 [Bacillus sp. FJAT-27264]
MERSHWNAKEEWSELVAPPELEERLRTGLNRVNPHIRTRRRFTAGLRIAVAIIAVTLVISNQYHALAYYGKKLLGYDIISDGTLKKLNDRGWGQSLDKRVTLANGTELALDGIMSDANQFIIYYTLIPPSSKLATNVIDSLVFLNISGYQTKSSSTKGGGFSVQGGGESAFRFSAFEPVSPLAKNLTLTYMDYSLGADQRQMKQLTFPYHPDEAMTTQIKQSIDKSLTFDNSTLTFKSITATPTMTLIEGSIQGENQLLLSNKLLDVGLIANGQTVSRSSSQTNNRTGDVYDFSIDYDAIPEDLHTLQLEVRTFPVYRNTLQRLPLTELNIPLSLEGQAIRVLKIEHDIEGTKITLEMDEDVFLQEFSLETKDGLVPLKKVVDSKYVKRADGGDNKIETLLFDTSLKPEYLQIKEMVYTERYGKTIDIPLK